MTDAVEYYKAKGLDLSKILYKPDVDENIPVRNVSKQEHNLSSVIDFKILKNSRLAIEKKIKMNLDYTIKNTDRTVGAIISNEISKKYGEKGLPKGTLKLNFTGAAGQSFGAFATKGLEMKIEGNTNDYFGKGLSGATLIVKIPKKSTFKSHENIITGNVALYGATSGEAYINGIAGERFCVRNSGATAVVEGVGDHGCEYMTGGIALILGKIGRNFAAGMSGGIAYIYKLNNHFRSDNFNMEMVEFEKLDKQDFDIIKDLLEKHYSYTQSSIAEKIILNWERSRNMFIKVMPTEYKTALEKMAQSKINEIIN